MICIFIFIGFDSINSVLFYSHFYLFIYLSIKFFSFHPPGPPLFFPPSVRVEVCFEGSVRFSDLPIDGD
ncbi:hypothetical protein BDV35DRAFT_163772 [Aspergillus flavus]|uniref:Uncharacterized protein n=1 Tax=Aspergillus flavus TaxID=5059 RepID=A0A5N6H7Q0_ASPFL|nr:hypothetical protein BDV35DRAFT_163772 [Aspergillus flavus]